MCSAVCVCLLRCSPDRLPQHVSIRFLLKVGAQPCAGGPPLRCAVGAVVAGSCSVRALLAFVPTSSANMPDTRLDPALHPVRHMQACWSPASHHARKLRTAWSGHESGHAVHGECCPRAPWHEPKPSQTLGRASCGPSCLSRLSEAAQTRQGRVCSLLRVACPAGVVSAAD